MNEWMNEWMNGCRFFFWKAESKFEIILIIEAESKFEIILIIEAESKFEIILIIEAESKFEIILIIEWSFQRGKTKGTFTVFRKKRLGKLM